MNQQNLYDQWAGLGLDTRYSNTPYGDQLARQARTYNPFGQQQAALGHRLDLQQAANMWERWIPGMLHAHRRRH